jgi:hypothetical protein
MAKKKSGKPESKSDFLRKVLGKDPGLDQHQVNRKWATAGHVGEISNALFYQVRSKMGIKTTWQWVQEPAPVARPAPGSSRAAGPSKSTTSKVKDASYQLKITPGDIRPPIWRRLLVSDCSLTRLHEVLQVAMGWQNYHLYSFEVGGTSYTDPRGAADLDMEDAGRAKLSEVLLKEKAKLRYTYDFGDNWEHEVVVEKILPPGEGPKYPECLDGKRASPPEDVGGPWGYADFVQAISDPGHEQHEEMLEWRGKFDPEAFDLQAVNKGLRRLKERA